MKYIIYIYTILFQLLVRLLCSSYPLPTILLSCFIFSSDEMSFSLLFGLLEVKTTLFFQWLKQVKPCCKWSNHIQSSCWFILMCCFLCWMCSVPYLGWWSAMFKRFSPRGVEHVEPAMPRWHQWLPSISWWPPGIRFGQYRFWADVFRLQWMVCTSHMGITGWILWYMVDTTN
jgi:hypothetical protein